MKLDHTHKNRFKMDYGLKFRPDAIKILEENIGSKIWDIARSNILPDVSPQAKETKEKINKWDYIKPHTFCTAKKTINKIKDNAQNGEHICQLI